MASAAITLPPPTTSRRTSWWRESLVVRWAPRLAFAAPLAITSIVVDARGFGSVPHTALEVHGELARAGGPAALGWAYPPAPTFLASVLPGGALALALVASLLAGVAMASLWHRLRSREVSIWLTAVLLTSMAAVPSALYGATQDIAALAGLAFLIVALDGFVSFTVERDTGGGFRAGLMLALAFGCDPVALLYAAALAGAAPFLAHGRYRSEPDAAVATASVLVFPVAAAAAAWAFLEWRFTGGVFTTLRTGDVFFRFDDGVVGGLADAARFAGRAALHAPVYLAVGGLLFARRQIAAIGYVVPLIGLALTHWIGLPFSDATAFMLLAAIGIVTVPSRPGRLATRILVAAAVLQVALGVWATTDGVDMRHFLHVLA